MKKLLKKNKEKTKELSEKTSSENSSEKKKDRKQNKNKDKKQNKDKNKKQDAKKNKKESEEEKKDYQDLFAQSFVPVEDIRDGIIKIKKEYGGDYLMIAEIEPITFMLRSPSERASIIEDMYAWLKIAPANLQFKMISAKADVSRLVHNIIKRTEDETSKKVLERRDKYIQKIKDLAVSQGLSKRFYIIFKYEGGNLGISTDFNDIKETLYTTYNDIHYYFNRMGNSIVMHEDENLFLANLIYTGFNPKSSVNETLEDRMYRINFDYEVYYKSIGKELKEVPLDNYFAPRGLDITNENYIILDGMYCTYLFLRDDGYRHKVVSGWMENFMQFGEGVDVNMYVKKMDHSKAYEAAGRSMRNKRAEAKDNMRSDENVDLLLSGAENASYVREQMSEYNEDLYNVCIMIGIRAKTPKELEAIKNMVIKRLKARDYLVEDCYMRHDKAFMMSLPLLRINDEIFKKGRRNFLTSSLASSYMFTAFELFDDNGVLFGINAANSSLAVANIFNTQRYKNANATICGTSGMGKTFFLQELGYSLRLSDIPVYYILPYKGYEYKKACKAIGGEYISLAPGSDTCINIMAIRPQKELDADLIDDEVDVGSLLSKKIHQIITFIQLLKPKEQMSDVEETQLNIVLTKLYEKHGIDEDNESIWLDKNKKLVKTMPIIEELYDLCMEDNILKKRIAVALRPFVQGTCTNMNGQTNVNLDNKYIIFDVSNAEKIYLAPFAFIATDCAYDAIKNDRSKSKALIMDEVWKMMLNTYCAEFVMEIYKIIRGYGGAAISATQDISDFLEFEGGVYGKKIITTSRTKFILGAEKSELEALSEVVDLDTEDLKALSKYERGQVLMVANGDKVPMFITGTDEEIEIFTTDAKVLRQIQEKKAKEKADETISQST